MNRLLRIASIGTRGIPSNYSGLETSSECLYSNLAERGHEISVYCRPDPSCADTTYRGVRRIEVPALRTKSLETLSHVAISLAHALTRERYDLIHLHALAPGVFARACKLSGIPMVATVQGLDWQRAKWKGMGSKVIRFGEQSIVKNADGLIVVSRDLRRYFKEQYGRDVAYIPNGVEGPVRSQVDGSYLHKQFGLTPGEYLLYLGRLVPEKRIADVLVAYRETESPYKLVITGESGYTDQYVSHLRSLAQQDDRVLFTGLQKRDVVHALLANASAYLSASEIEGLPMSLLECMWHGTPAILSEIPPHKELFDAIPGYDLLFEVGSVDQMKACLTRFLNNQSRYKSIAGLGRQRILQDYSWTNIARQTEELLLNTVQAAATVSRDMPRPRKDTLGDAALPLLGDLGSVASGEPYAD